MKSIIAKRGWLIESDLRLDAAFHLSDGQSTRHYFKEKGVNTKPLDDPQITEKIFYGGRDRRTYVKDPIFGLPFIKGADIVKSDFSNLKNISRKRTAKLDEYFLQEGWTLITRSGTIGNTAYVNKDFLNKAASDDIIRVVPSKIKSGFLYAFLSSKYGQALLKGGTYGAVIQHIEPEHICGLPVPIFPPKKQEEIHNLITQAADLRVEANRLFTDAIHLLESIIGESQMSLCYQSGLINAKEISTFQLRIDSQYQLLFKKFKSERKKELQYKKLNELAFKISVGNRNKRIYVSSGIPFVSSSDMMLYNPKKYAKQISLRTNGINDLLVSKNTILISRSGTVGNTVIIGDDLNGTAVSEHALRLIIDENKIHPNYVFCYLNTKQGKKQMEASAFGSVIITLNEDLIGNIEIPIISKDMIEEIVDKVNQYLKKIDKSVELDNTAVQIIENEIDQWQQ